jgi:DNA-binding protein HU-beta
MKKVEVIKKVAKCAGVSTAVARECIDCYHNVISGELSLAKDFSLSGIGKLSIAHRAARKGRNFMTGEIIKISAKKVVKFKASNSLLIR